MSCSGAPAGPGAVCNRFTRMHPSASNYSRGHAQRRQQCSSGRRPPALALEQARVPPSPGSIDGACQHVPDVLPLHVRPPLPAAPCCRCSPPRPALCSPQQNGDRYQAHPEARRGGGRGRPHPPHPHHSDLQERALGVGAELSSGLLRPVLFKRSMHLASPLSHRCVALPHITLSVFSLPQVKNLEKVCADLIRGAKEKQLKVQRGKGDAGQADSSGCRAGAVWLMPAWRSRCSCWCSERHGSDAPPATHLPPYPPTCAGEGPRAHAHPRAEDHHPQVPLR